MLRSIAVLVVLIVGRYGRSVASDEPALCYANVSARFEPLRGSWGNSTHEPTYWNLSCPLEWSKYSCVHQGAEAHALESRSLTFKPANCELPRLLKDEYERVFPRQGPGRRIIFQGDSHMRQVFIAFSCLISAHVQSFAPEWHRVQPSRGHAKGRAIA